MQRTQFFEAQLRQGPLDAKTLDSMFRRRIEEGANCPPFVSLAILSIGGVPGRYLPQTTVVS
jgi:hypothetical protein